MAKELKIRITGDASGLQKGTKDAEGILSGFGSKVSAWSVAAGTLLADGIKTGVKGAIGLIGSSISEASDLNESASKINQLFGEGSSAINDFAASAATGLGQSKLQALDAAATFGTFGRAAGLAGEDLVRFSTNNVKMASDFASFFNDSPEGAIEAIGAAFRGETEPIRKYGIMLDAASIKAKALQLGLAKGEVDTLKLSRAQETAEKAQRKYNEQLTKFGDGSTEASDAARDLEQAQLGMAAVMEGSVPELTNQQKILAAQQLIFEQGAAAQGDFAETSGGLANQQRILAAQFDNLKGRIGQAFLPAAQKLVSFANTKLLPAISALADKWIPRFSTAFKALVSGFQNFADGATTSGVFGFFEQIGIYAGQTVAWFQKLAAVFRSGGWTAALGEMGKKLVDVWLWASDWLYTSALPAVGRALLAIGRKFGTWVTETAVPYLQANMPIWLAALGSWLETTAIPWLGEKSRQLASLLGGWISQAVGYLWENLPGWIAAFADWYYGTALPWVAGKMGELAVKLGDWIVQGAQSLRDNLPTWIGAFVEWAVGTALPTILEKAAEWQLKIVEWVAQAAIDLAVKLPEWIAAFNTWAASEALPALLQFGKDLLAKLGEGVAGANDFLYDVGVNVVAGMIRGLQSMAGSLRSAATSLVADNIPGPVRDLLGISSPSKVFHRIGMQTAQGLAGGMLAGTGMVSAASGRLAGAALPSGPSFSAQRSYGQADLSGGELWSPARQTVIVEIDGRQVVMATARPAEFVHRAGR